MYKKLATQSILVKGRINLPSPELRKHFSIGEAEEHVAGMTDAEYKRIILLIEQLNPHRAGCTGEDLFEAALRKILSGDRKWPRHVKLPTFVHQVVRSLLSNEIKKKQDAHPLATNIDSLGDIENDELTAHLANDEAAIARAVQELTNAFDDDGDIRCIMLNKLRNQKAFQIKINCKLTEQTYQSAMKRLKRQALKLFPEGVDYWRDET